ncbi:MAG: TetR family transcriptional regulator [Gaiellaceae bacterium]|jgi:AcrR family transcriptional regulator
MSSPAETDPPPLGPPEPKKAKSCLRERKKARTVAAIQTEALRLFREQGYEATTIEQIAEAAEVSASTFYRYFPTKEELLIFDAYDAPLIEAFRAQPPQLGAIQAIRTAIRSVFSELSAEQLAQERERTRLMLSNPELRARMLEELANAMQMMAVVIAERAGRRPDELAVRTFAGALIGVGMSTMLAVIDDPKADYFELFDAGLEQLESGFDV